jgi:hypothetical protein
MKRMFSVLPCSRPGLNCGYQPQLIKVYSVHHFVNLLCTFFLDKKSTKKIKNRRMPRASPAPVCIIPAGTCFCTLPSHRPPSGVTKTRCLWPLSNALMQTPGLLRFR